MIERLKNKFGVNQPIFTYEILREMSDYSRPRVFQLLKKAEESQQIIKFDQGVYYIPTNTRYGKSLITVEQVVMKKYISSNDEVYGLYSGIHLQQNFLMTYQIPIDIEIVTNNETMCIREVKIGNRNIILRKSRTTINKNNINSYTLLELFSNIDLNQYNEDDSIKREIIDFIKTKKINSNDVFKLAGYFPAKTIKNIVESGIINELT